MVSTDLKSDLKSDYTPSTRIAIYYEDCEQFGPYFRYGLQHFMEKYKNNFLAVNTIQSADVYLCYFPLENCDCKIQMIFKSGNADGLIFLKVGNEKVPVFKKPVKTTGDINLIKAVNGNEEYACLSIINNRIIAGFDIFTEIGNILAGKYDSQFLRKDELGKMLRSFPVVDILEDAIYNSINQILPNLRLQPGSIWPDNHRFALVLTHDVDEVRKKTQQYMLAILKSIKDTDLNKLGYNLKNFLFKHGKNNPYWTFDKICEMENSLGVKSTYFLLNETGRVNPFSLKSWILYTGRYHIQSPSVQRAIRNLEEKGFEIGVHGSYKSYRSLELLQSEKRILESITGSKMIGIRQHHLNYDNSVTPGLHGECSFMYDTSIGFKVANGIGFRRGTSFPFHIMLPDLNVSPVLEIPLIIMDSSVISEAVKEECFEIINRVEKYLGVLTILWHSKHFNQNEFPDKVDLYKRIVNVARKRDAWITRAQDVYKWIEQKESNISDRNIS